LGVLERRKVASEVKGLEQPARAGLRKFGVRFGAHHIYFPALLKPAPRSLAVQLWTVQQGGREMAGLDIIERLAASGRTSIVADKAIDRALYAIAGYQVCGERAVRVDMLERLADQIRPALAWREGSPGTKPAAAFDGSGTFKVVVGMTSLVGCAGEEFAAILRSLGYRMEKRPKPTDPPASPPEIAAPQPAQPSEDAPVSSAEPTEAAGEMAAATESTLMAAEEAKPPPAEPLAEPAAADREVVPVTDSPPVAAADVQAPTDEATSAETAEPAPLEPQGTTEPAPAAAAEAEPEFVEVWRLGRADGPRRHPRGRRVRPPPRAASVSAEAAAAAAVEAIPAPAEGQSISGEGREAAPADRPERKPRQHHRRGHSERDRAERGERPGRPQRSPREDRPDRDPELRAKYFKGGRAEARRDKAPDPNSPFAKLAALKEQLEADAKERR
jgi:ATP-dependent RNA helicase SUPV3L1/SUV3